MPSSVNTQSVTNRVNTVTGTAMTVNVAVAVIHYQDWYLLGFRSAAQHQGNRYEFVGGKIEASETAEQALIREVAEETGIDIQDNIIVKLGRLHHNYGDKQVSLQVYKSELTDEQFTQYKDCQYGLEGQALTWVPLSELLAERYPLPAANKTILEWLRVPAKITITYPLAYFNDCSDSTVAWLEFHQEKLTTAAWVYIRVKDVTLRDSQSLAAKLLAARPDIRAILPYDDRGAMSKSLVDEDPMAAQDSITNDHVVAHHLTQSDLMQWTKSIKANLSVSVAHTSQSDILLNGILSSNQPLIISCHDTASIQAANQLASARLQKNLPPVIGVFISPVLTTQTHPDTVPLGWKNWSALAQLADMPVIGLGGLSPNMIDHALQYGGISVAGIRQFL